MTNQNTERSTEAATENGTANINVDADGRILKPVGPIKRPDGGDVALAADDPLVDAEVLHQGDWLKVKGETSREWIAGKVGGGVVEVSE